MGKIFSLADTFMPRFKRRSIVTRLSRAKGDDISHFAQAPDCANAAIPDRTD
jgi:hypothetical protein